MGLVILEELTKIGNQGGNALRQEQFFMCTATNMSTL
jgi:hypothetical protein